MALRKLLLVCGEHKESTKSGQLNLLETGRISLEENIAYLNSLFVLLDIKIRLSA